MPGTVACRQRLETAPSWLYSAPPARRYGPAGSGASASTSVAMRVIGADDWAPRLPVAAPGTPERPAGRAGGGHMGRKRVDRRVAVDQLAQRHGTPKRSAISRVAWVSISESKPSSRKLARRPSAGIEARQIGQNFSELVGHALGRRFLGRRGAFCHGCRRVAALCAASQRQLRCGLHPEALALEGIGRQARSARRPGPIPSSRPSPPAGHGTTEDRMPRSCCDARRPLGLGVRQRGDAGRRPCPAQPASQASGRDRSRWPHADPRPAAPPSPHGSAPAAACVAPSSRGRWPPSVSQSPVTVERIGMRGACSRTRATSARNGATASSIMCEWKAWLVCSRCEDEARLLEPRGEGFCRRPRPGDDTELRAIYRRQVEPGPREQWHELRLGGADRDHNPARQIGHQAPAQGDEPQRVGKVDHPARVAAASSPTEWPTITEGVTPQCSHCRASA
jgi:hypothetical protein